MQETPAGTAPQDLTLESISATLARLNVAPDIGLTRAEADARRQIHGYNEVAERKEHAVFQFLRKFWGISACSRSGGIDCEL